MNVFTVDRTVGELVAERPSRSRVFERLGIDYCCGGKKPLARACAEKGLSPEEVVEQLRSSDDEAASRSERNWGEASMTELVDHIEEVHHAYLRSELPRLRFLTGKVRNAHGGRHPKLADVERTFSNLEAELVSHMQKEEQVLFPLIRRLETSAVAVEFHCGSIGNPISAMEREHDEAARGLETLRSLTDGYAPPVDACNTYRAMLDGLRDLETDLHRHIHKENNVLFPKALGREGELSVGA
jgi:regulator of cell morphogenesis and NO signaling